jgi:hypothetical protein
VPAWLALRVIASKKEQPRNSCLFNAASRAGDHAAMATSSGRRWSRAESMVGRASRQLDLGAVRALLEDGHSPNRRDRLGITPLMNAVGDGRIVSALLDADADPDARDRGAGWSALHFAADDAQDAALRALLDARAPPDARDHAGQTPLHVAAARAGHAPPGEACAKCERVLRPLLQAGAAPFAADTAGDAPADVAWQEGARCAGDLLRDAMFERSAGSRRGRAEPSGVVGACGGAAAPAPPPLRAAE